MNLTLSKHHPNETVIARTINEKEQMVQWFLRFAWDHAGTINFDHQSNRVYVGRQFIRNFNRAIFGRGKVKSDPERFKLYVLPVYADDTKNKHLHFAFAGFPQTCDESHITRAFHKAAKQTKGVKTAWANGTPALHITPIKSASSGLGKSERWLRYMLRFTKKLQDGHLMLELANLDTRVSFNHICENIIDLRTISAM